MKEASHAQIAQMLQIGSLDVAEIVRLENSRPESLSRVKYLERPHCIHTDVQLQIPYRRGSS